MKHNKELRIYMEPMREYLYFFRKRYGGYIDVTQIGFQTYLDLHPELNIIKKAGIYQDRTLKVFLDNVYKANGTTATVQKDESPQAYSTLLAMYEKPADFDSWSYEAAMKLYDYIVITKQDKELNPLWYTPKESRYTIAHPKY